MTRTTVMSVDSNPPNSETGDAKSGSPYKSYVALLNQHLLGTTENIQFEVGKEYYINIYQDGDDFTNVGAASNVSGIHFIATGTTAANWSNGSFLQFRFELTVTVLNSNDSNYLGDISWERTSEGSFEGTLSTGEFTDNKTALYYGKVTGGFITMAVSGTNTVHLETQRLFIQDVNILELPTDDMLNQNTIKIEVYQS